MITFEPQYRCDFTCSIAEHYVPKGFCSVSDFEWKEIKL